MISYVLMALAMLIMGKRAIINDDYSSITVFLITIVLGLSLLGEMTNDND